MVKCCRPLKVDVFQLQEENALRDMGWKPAGVSQYQGQHGVSSPSGEHEAKTAA